MNEMAQLSDLFSAEDGLNFNTGRAARMASAGKTASKPPMPMRKVRETVRVKKARQVLVRAKSVA